MRLHNLFESDTPESLIEDYLDIEITEDFAIETRILEFTPDGNAIVEIDDQALELMDLDEEQLNEFIPLIIGGVALGLTAYDAYTNYKLYKNGDITGKQLAAKVGTDAAIGLATGGIVKIAGKSYKGIKNLIKGKEVATSATTTAAVAKAAKELAPDVIPDKAKTSTLSALATQADDGFDLAKDKLNKNKAAKSKAAKRAYRASNNSGFGTGGSYSDPLQRAIGKFNFEAISEGLDQYTDPDGEEYECMACNYIGDNWVENDNIKDIEDPEANAMLCPKCHSEHYYTYERNVAEDEEFEPHMMHSEDGKEEMYADTEELHLELKAKGWNHGVTEWVQELGGGSKWTGQEINFIQDLCKRHDGIQMQWPKPQTGADGIKGPSPLWDKGNIMSNDAALQKLMSWVEQNKIDVESYFRSLFRVYSNKDSGQTQSDGNQVLDNIKSKIGAGVNEAEYQGRKVKLNKPMQGDVKKSKVYVKNEKGNVVKVNFGHGGSSAKGKTMSIKKNNPARRKSFRARHNCSSPGPKHKARYWSCKAW